tara:strand:- start:43 stop:1215 length:1173 start_codon:yes stop_codon:yes gene_type:complete
MALKNNTWKLNQWYDQNVAGNADYSGAQEIYSWAFSPNGQSGRNTQGPSSRKSSPTQIGSLTTWSSISGYYDGFFYGATKTDGTLWAWGNNANGYLGQNNKTKYSSPVQVGSDTTWAISVAAAKKSGFATKTDGTLWAWGYNARGELGQNNRTEYSSPVQVGSDTTWPTTKNKFGGTAYSVAAIKTDGTLWSWGYNNFGNLGQNEGGPSSKYSSPVQIPGSWDTISKPTRYMQVAIKTGGTLWSWGYNTYGQLGQNLPTNSHRSSPVQVPGTTWKLVCGSASSINATKTDGTMWAWGRNTNGILGQNNLTNYSSPVQVGSSTDWDIPLQLGFIGGGIKTDGTLWSWGYNGSGHLGQNDRTSRSSPVQIPGIWVDMAASGEQGSIMAMNLI